MTIAQFTTLSSQAHPSFWNKLTEHKLDVLRLSDAQVEITASYGVGRQIKDREANAWVGMNGSLAVEEDSFNKTIKSPLGSTATPGIVKNYNTIEDFKAADKTKLFNECADKIWSSIVESKSTAELNRFLVITYADLKKYKYYYWFAFPAFTANPPWNISEPGLSPPTDSAQMQAIYDQLSKQEPKLPHFLILESGNKVVPVEDYAQYSSEKLTVGFIDPSAQSQNPGWPLRNLLTFLHVVHGVSNVSVLCWRDAEPPRADQSWHSRFATFTLDASATVPTNRPSAVGWEKNVNRKLGPRVADLAPMMDPTRLANQAVDLNLKLMRWRILPSLDLEKIANTKVLLLGAGTLGCYVARCLMGWGVRKISLVDSARVSFSNPVRQPLFQFTDCLNGGRPKAECAAERLKEVWPGLDARGYTMSIPMPGHPIPASPPSIKDQIRKDVEQLEKLIEEHDVVYLLMDSRESRWLPTVLGRLKGKLVMNAALGFDTFLVMRHGARAKDAATAPTEGVNTKNLGCYYCNDVVAPADSLTDRTLDQMCTVTRPGLASIASSTAVEMMMSVLQHPDGIHAPAPPPVAPGSTTVDMEGEGTSVLGLAPHQIRGFLAQFRNIPIVGAAYDKCTGCSELVLREYEKEGFEMVVKACADSKYLESVTGLDKLFDERTMEEVDWAEAEGDEDDF